MMKCQDLRELLSAYADGELAPLKREFIETHLAGCPDCRATLAKYQNDARQLTSLITPSPAVSITDRVIARIKSSPRSGKRRWLRPALAGAVACAVVAAIITLAVLPGPSPRDELAQALSHVQNLTTYRFYKTLEVRLPETSTWLIYSYAWVDYAGSNRHMKNRIDLDYSDGVVDDWTERELIISDNVVYLWKLTTPGPLSREIENQLWKETTSQVEKPFDDFRLLAQVKKLPDERINDAECLHYRGLVDMTAWIEKQKVLSEPIAHEVTQKLYDAAGDNLTNAGWAAQWAAEQWAKTERQIEITWSNKQVELEYWIGKDDNLLHQFRYAETASAKALEFIPFSEDHRETMQYSDFNTDILIQPPLDAQGNLLPDWTIQKD